MRSQLEAAYKYLKSHDALDAAELERACGVGISFTPAQIKASLAASIEARRAELLADRYVAVPAAFVAAKQALEWGDARLIKEEVRGSANANITQVFQIFILCMN